MTGALIYCNILWTCRNFADWSRARQWSAGFESWCDASFAESTGSCDLHRAELAGVRKDLPSALQGIGAAIAKLTEEEGWALGEGYRVRGDVLAMIGDLDKARDDYARAYAVGWDAEPGNAVLLVETGAVDAALGALDRTLSGTTWFHLQRGLWLRAHKAWIAARHGRADLARSVLDDIGIEIGATTTSAPSIHALLAEAQAHLQAEDASEGMRLLLLACQLWTAAGFEFQEARVRIEIAERLHAAGDDHGARVERVAAEHIARRIGSRRLLNILEAAQDVSETDRAEHLPAQTASWKREGRLPMPARLSAPRSAADSAPG